MSWKSVALGVLAIAAAAATVVPLGRSRRSVIPLPEADGASDPRLDLKRSTALFVGVKHFKHDDLTDVRYAVDDAIDLAHVFVFDRRVHLVQPERVVLALSGKAVKEESQRRLHELEDAGAEVHSAEPGEILMLAERQASRAGSNGLFILSVATHGFTREGQTQLLGASSVVSFPETTISEAKLRDMAAAAASRSLVFIDACRERMTTDMRAVQSGALTAAPRLEHRMRYSHGQAVFYAAAPGKYAYDDDVHGNGVFTEMVIAGLRGNAACIRGAVTAQTLATFVERSVLEWIRRNRDPSAQSATQCDFEGDTHNMPLALCDGGDGPGPDRVSWRGATVTAFQDGKRLWQRDLAAPVLHAEALDIENDGPHEVVAGTANGIAAFDADGKRLWTVRDAGRMTLRAFRAGHLLRKRSYAIAALWVDEWTSASCLTIYDATGHRVSTLAHAGHLQQLAIDRPTPHFGWKIVVTGVDRAGACVLLLNPKSIQKPLWYGNLTPDSETIERLDIVDYDQDDHRDIALTTSRRARLFVDFKGKVIGREGPPVGFALLKPHRVTRARAR
jgi:Caspase domain